MKESKKQDSLAAENAKSGGKPILVAEDDAMNQDIIQRQLNRLGYKSDIASDGMQALEMWREGEYELVLTDLHMPVMDGFELTAALRKEEESQDRRTTIIAVTANATHGEQQKCLDAGMDAYLTKPLGMKAFREALDQWRGAPAGAEKNNGTPPVADSNDSRPAAGPTSEAVTDSMTGKAIDEGALREMFGDDPELFEEILNDFLAPAKANIEQIQTGFKDRVAGEVQAGAHKLKSSARSVGAHALADAAVVLEAAAKIEDWSAIEEKTAALPELMDQVETFVNAL